MSRLHIDILPFIRGDGRINILWPDTGCHIISKKWPSDFNDIMPSLIHNLLRRFIYIMIILACIFNVK